MLRAKSDRRNNIKSPISAPPIAFRPRTLAITAATMRRPPSIRAIPPPTDAISAPTIQRHPPIRVIPAVTRPTTASTLHFPSRTIATTAAAFANRGGPMSSRTTVRDKNEVDNREYGADTCDPHTHTDVHRSDNRLFRPDTPDSPDDNRLLPSHNDNQRADTADNHTNNRKPDVQYPAVASTTFKSG